MNTLTQFRSQSNIGVADIQRTISQGIDSFGISRGKRVLVIVPDDTRSFDARLFHALVKEIKRRHGIVTILIATGTHSAMSPAAIQKYFQLTGDGAAGVDEFFNHDCNAPLDLVGTLRAEDVVRISGGRIAGEIPIRLNPLVRQNDIVIVLGPVFPHEVMGFSAGAKYLMPGVSGPEIINQTHYLGALLSVTATIGRIETPMRTMIETATQFIQPAIFHVSFVIAPDGDTRGLYVGGLAEAQRAAARQSLEVNVVYTGRRYKIVIALMPAMFGELWTAGKGSYKLGGVVQQGGQLIIVAPNITSVAEHHSDVERLGYHCMAYHIANGSVEQGYELSAIAHSSHVAGDGTFVDGVEQLHAERVLATGISPDRCAALGVGYADPGDFSESRLAALAEDPDVLIVRNAGEVLYLVEPMVQ